MIQNSKPQAKPAESYKLNRGNRTWTIRIVDDGSSANVITIESSPYRAPHHRECRCVTCRCY